MSDKLEAVLCETPTGPVVASISKFKGKHRLDIRQYYIDNGERKPTPKGLNVLLDNGESIFQGLSSLLDTAEAKGLTVTNADSSTKVSSKKAKKEIQ